MYNKLVTSNSAVQLSWLEHAVHTRSVIGSNPITATNGPVVKRPKTPPFHGGNTSSNLVRVTKRNGIHRQMNAASFFFSLFSPITVSEEKARESIAAHKTSLHLSALPTKAGLRFILMPAEQFKSTVTRACWCKLLNCSGARFLRNFAKNLAL